MEYIAASIEAQHQTVHGNGRQCPGISQPPGTIVPLDNIFSSSNIGKEGLSAYPDIKRGERYKDDRVEVRWLDGEELGKVIGVRAMQGVDSSAIGL